MVMTLVLPGSAQLVAGRKDVGRLAIRVWLGTLRGRRRSSSASARCGTASSSTLGSNTFVLGLLRIWLALLAVGWALLLIDAWRLGQPLQLTQRQRLAVVGVNGLLVFVVAGSLLFASHIVAVQRGLHHRDVRRRHVSAAEDGRYNVLLIGGDEGAGRWGLRTDSMTVASIDEETGKTILFGLPRNMTNFPFPEGSVLDEKFPNGYDCETCELNSLATWAADHKALFGDSPTPGIDATIMGIEGITGLKINYYALVNLDGLPRPRRRHGRADPQRPRPHPDRGAGHRLHRARRAEAQRLRDALVRPLARVRRRLLADGAAEVRDERDGPAAQPADGASRSSRTLAKAGTELVETNLPASELDAFAQLALKARSQKIASVSFVPPAIITDDPDIDKIRDDDRRRHREVRGAGREGARRKPTKGFTANTRRRDAPAARWAACPAATPPTRPTTSRRSAEPLRTRP